MNTNETRFSYREETFDDNAVRELAKVRARCICMLQYGRCLEEECKDCPTNARFHECYKEVSSYNKLRIDQYTNEYYRIESSYSWTGFKSQISILVFSFVFVILSVLALFYVCSNC